MRITNNHFQALFSFSTRFANASTDIDSHLVIYIIQLKSITCDTHPTNLLYDTALRMCVEDCGVARTRVRMVFCVACGNRCVACAEVGRCLACRQGYRVFEGGCVLVCPVGAYLLGLT
jgi:hypothetical protein